MNTWGVGVGYTGPTGGIHVCPVYVSGYGFNPQRASGPSIPPETPTQMCGCGS
jgi:hypothetical protein